MTATNMCSNFGDKWVSPPPPPPPPGKECVYCVKFMCFYTEHAYQLFCSGISHFVLYSGVASQNDTSLTIRDTTKNNLCIIAIINKT